MQFVFAIEINGAAKATCYSKKEAFEATPTSSEYLMTSNYMMRK